jgi:hypothetical protein
MVCSSLFVNLYPWFSTKKKCCIFVLPFFIIRVVLQDHFAMPGHSRPYHQIWMMYLLGEFPPNMTEINVLYCDTWCQAMLSLTFRSGCTNGWHTPLETDNCNDTWCQVLFSLTYRSGWCICWVSFPHKCQRKMYWHMMPRHAQSYLKIWNLDVR